MTVFNMTGTTIGEQDTGVSGSADHIELAGQVTAHNYHPLPVVISEAHGCWVTDVEGTRYLDCLSGYSALNFGHSHPLLVAEAVDQLQRLTLTSRAFHNDQLAPFARDLAALAGMETVLPMNTGAEAVETAIKISRRWGYEVKGVPDGRANIVVAENNFHGRTTTIVSFSNDAVARDHYGPYTPGFTIVPFGDIDAMRAAVDEFTVAVLIEPIQGEAGVIIPPEGYLAAVRRLCDERGTLLVLDEIQSGLGRTGRTFASEHEDVVPDMYVLGKALGGGIIPVSAVVSRHDVMDVITPGSHGSTFGGNPLAARVGHAVVRLLATGEYQERAAQQGRQMKDGLESMLGRGLTTVRARGLWAGIDIDPALMTGREMCERLMARGVLAKDTHVSTVRLAPPLIVEASEIDWLLEQVEDSLTEG